MIEKFDATITKTHGGGHETNHYMFRWDLEQTGG